MAGQSGFTHCRVRFESALQTYEKETGITLAQHPLTLQLQNCRSVETTASFLQDQIPPSTDFGRSDRLIGSIRRTISILHNLGAAAALAWASDMVYEMKALMACSTPLTAFFYRYSHPKMQYMPASPSYFLYVPFFSSTCVSS